MALASYKIDYNREFRLQTVWSQPVEYIETIAHAIGVCGAYECPEDPTVNALLILLYRVRRIAEYISTVGLAVLASYMILGARW